MASSELSTDFVQQVRDAIRHLHDRTHLQTHSLAPFASPPSDKRTTGRGKRLQDELLQAIQALQPAPNTPAELPVGRNHQLLVLRYVEALETAEVQKQLAVGKTEYYADHQQALDAVASILWERWQPRDFPPPELLRPEVPPVLASQSVEAQPAAFEPFEKRRNNLPSQLTSFVGRQTEMMQIQQFLASSRLITLVGVGGTGKTRLALQVAADLFERFPDGVWFIDLAPSPIPPWSRGRLPAPSESPSSPVSRSSRRWSRNCSMPVAAAE